MQLNHYGFLPFSLFILFSLSYMNLLGTLIRTFLQHFVSMGQTKRISSPTHMKSAHETQTKWFTFSYFIWNVQFSALPLPKCKLLFMCSLLLLFSANFLSQCIHIAFLLYIHILPSIFFRSIAHTLQSIYRTFAHRVSNVSIQHTNRQAIYIIFRH